MAIKAAGGFDLDATPRELADRFMAEAGLDGAPDPGAAEAQPLFTDVAPALGLHFAHDNAARGNFLLPEEMGPGAGFLDADGDGDLDVFVAGGGAVIGDGPAQTCRIYRNDGDRFADVTDDWGAGVPGPAYGVACADYDDDGDVDIFVTRLGPNALLRNDGTRSHPRFVEVAQEAGIADEGFGASSAFLDFDRDGRLDLYVTNYVGWSAARRTPCYSVLGARDYCNPRVYQAPSPDRLYRNLGGGMFEDVSESAGIAVARGNGLGVLASDFDGDGWIDIYVANDQTPAFLWRNRGDGTFEDVAALAGCAYDGRGVAVAGMGVAGEDLDGDGDTDLLVGNIHDQTHLILLNDGGFFEDASLSMGLGRWSYPATAFGVVLFDQDRDGGLDAFFANGEVNIENALGVGDNPLAQPDHFARLVGGQLVDRTAGSGVAFEDVGRGAACGDYDNDGDLDLLVANNGGPLRLLRNNDQTGHAWLGVEARTGPGSRHAIGARIIVRVGGAGAGVAEAGVGGAGVGGYRREIRPQQSYLCSSDPRAHFGLGDAERVERLEVIWPDGTVSVRTDIAVNQYVVVRQGPGSGDGP